jgi:plastocyanin
MRLVLCIAAIAVATRFAAAGPTGRVTGKVSVTEADGKPTTGAEVIVYVVGFSEPPAPTASVTVEQRGRKFVPELVAVTLGGKVNFPNKDAFLHNVFSQSSSRKFDLGSFKKGESKTKEFPSPGVVDVYCNIHPEMAATILVLPNQRHTRIAADGTFTLDGVPPGNWTVFAYTRRAPKPVSAKVSVTTGADTKVEFAIQRGAEPEHLNKYGEKYRAGAPNTYR